MKRDGRRCQARRKDGQPCRAWAKRDSDEALCSSHLKLAKSETGAAGFYEGAYGIEEAADLLFKANEKDLVDEVKVTRVAVRRILKHLQQELEPAEYARLFDLIFKGTHTIADIMRAQRSLSGAKDDLIPPEVDVAITKVGRKKGYDL